MRLIQHYPLLQRYREQLKTLREAWGNSRQLPDAPFFLFGMGARQKLIYQAGKLIDGHSCTIVREWRVAEETIAPPAYRVVLGTQQEELIEINENTSQSTVVVNWVWDSPESAKKFQRAMNTHLDELFQGGSVKRSDGDCWELNNHATCLFTRNSQSLWIVTPSQDQLNLLKKQFTDFP